MASLPYTVELLYSSAFYLALLIILWYSIDSVLCYRRLSHIPGPRLAGWSSLWLVGAVWRKQSHLEFYEVAKKHGELDPTQGFSLPRKDADVVQDHW